MPTIVVSLGVLVLILVAGEVAYRVLSVRRTATPAPIRARSPRAQPTEKPASEIEHVLEEISQAL